MSLSLCFITCDYLYPEMQAGVTAAGLSGVEVKSFPARCGRPPVRWQELAESIKSSKADNIELFGCYCFQDLEAPGPEFSHCRINRLEQCFHLFCSPSLVRGLQQNGAFLLTPGWLARWQQHVSQWGFDQETANDFLGQSLTRLLLLDTGMDDRASVHLDDFSSFLNLPCEILPIGLDFHQLFLTQIVADYQLQEKEQEKEKALRHSADSAMILDLLGRVTSSSSETEAKGSIIELFTMLLAPKQISYVRITKLGMRLDQVAELTDKEQQQLEKFYQLPDRQYQLNEAKDSFLLRIGRGSTVSAILCVQQLAFPQYIEHYLNVAIQVAEVSALAIDHARTIKKLLDTSRLAGKAEVATEILHNVGNTLNSISVSSERIHELLQASSSTTLPTIVELIEEHNDDPGDFFGNDPRGKKLPLYFSRLAQQLNQERQQLLDETISQLERIRLVAGIIRVQQDTAKGTILVEQVDLATIIEESLLFVQQQLKEKHIRVKRDYAQLPVMHGERHKILQVISNLINNGVDALAGMEQENNKIILRLYSVADEKIVLEVQDNGTGMSGKTLQQIFVFGFTTKKDGYGFGLHNAANLATMMHGKLTAESPGKGQGATFRLELPVNV